MKKLLFCLLMACGFAANAQVYNNEWIDYSKTYYKFKVGKTGLHRIPQSKLDSAGLGSIPAEQFQLWRNGVQVPIYTFVSTGILPASGYIEFWGEMNDGKPDKALYRRPEYQLNDVYSLQTDTAAYFLTVNPSGNNLRLVETENNLTGNTLAPEPYFMYTRGQYFKNQIHGGYAVDVDQLLYSASYDAGEGYSSNYVGTNATNTINFGNLFVYNGGPAAKFKISVSGSKIAERTYRVKINNDSILGNKVDFFNYRTDSVEVPLSLISGATNNVQVTNLTAASSDRMVIHKYELTYPRQFNFGNAANFEFTLPPSDVPRYLEIANFNNSSMAPVLYDLSNGRRYTGNTAVAGKIRILVQPSAIPQRLVLASTASANITIVASGLQKKNFVDYANPANQGDFLIISNRLLFNEGNGANPVEEYRQYRSSAAGGGYNAKIYEIDELTDQFGFGIKKTPLAIRNFILFARRQFAAAPKHVFLIGKGVVYTAQRSNESNPAIERLNLVPTFGNPASDVLLAAEPGTSLAKVSIGRLSAVTPQEISDYLAKVKEYEAAQQLSSADPKDKQWMKNVAHIIGSGDVTLQGRLEQYMSTAKQIISDTFFGANVHTFTKKTGSNVEQISEAALEHLFEEGISLITYFGHSSASGLDYNLDNPDAYRNKGKYPVFVALGCNAGNFYGFSAVRLTEKQAISEKYVLAPERGTIGFIASTHFGIVSYLRIWNTDFYESISRSDYGKSIGDALNSAASKVLNQVTEENFYARTNIEETALHGDPAVKLNVQEKPDYVLSEEMVKVSPGFVSIAESAFNLQINIVNTGKAIKDSISIEVKRQYPNGATATVIRKEIVAPMFTSALEFSIPIDPIRDKGLNKLSITLDADNKVDELLESNNTATKDIIIFEEEARPVYPYNFAIVSSPDIKLIASTANALSPERSYQFEIDTTELFNSPLKLSKIITSSGGVLEFQPSMTYLNNRVYYWRVAVVPENGDFNWNTSSFIYLENSKPGFNQSHAFQHFKSTFNGVILDSATLKWKYGMGQYNLFAKNAIYPTGGNEDGDFSVNVDGASYIRSACVGRSLIFNVFDARTFKPWKNVDEQGKNLFLYGSGSANCHPTRNYNFEFSYMTADSRKKMMDFMDIIPEGSFVVVRSTDHHNSNSYAATWRSDTTHFGSGNSLYHRLLDAGFAEVDSINKARAWILVYQKGGKSFKPKYAFTQGIYDKVSVSADLSLEDTQGYLISPKFGPAKAWQNFMWQGKSDQQHEFAFAKILGIKNDGVVDTLYHQVLPQQYTVDISSIDARQYPYLQLVMYSTDTVSYTPYDLNYWRLTYSPVPEGAVAPNIYFSMKDSLVVGEPINFKLVFKNISSSAFDSLKIKMVVTDKNNVQHALPVLKHRPLNMADTLHVAYSIDTKLFGGKNTLYVEVNPDNDQPEQFHFNNFIFHDFYVQEDQVSPILDVTFDNVHILNRDIVSAKPDILIKLKDESSQLLMNDSSLLTVKVRNLSNNSTRVYRFDNDTLRFNPASQLPDNTATVNFKPYFPEDGEYELIVTGKDRTGNKAGQGDYRILFQVINKPMISNMLNYPNPFTTSTAFVFTLTGSEVPQNLKIQILTITGKVVREITKEELGPIRIGRNITEFKWDGTDQFGQKLANGVYLYRVVTNLNGKSLDKFKSSTDDTDKYFNKGYGKMYLMR